MLIVLPDEINGLQEVEQKMSEMSLDDIRRRGSQVEVELYLPKFKIESTIDLKDTLTEVNVFPNIKIITFKITGYIKQPL